MNEIKRYDVNKANMIGLVRFDEKESGRWVKHEDHAAIVAALQEQVRALAEFKDKVRQSFLIGDAAEDFAVFTNIGNTLRRSGCLSAIEREFFTREVPDEEYPDEMGEECDFSWGKGPVEYTEDFRIALREIRAQVLDDMADDCQSDWPDNYVDELRSSAARIRAGEKP